MADEDDKKPEDEAGADDSSQETAVGHSVVEEGGRETAVGHPVVEADSVAADEGTTEVFFSREDTAAAPSGAVAAGDQPTAAPQPSVTPQPAPAPPPESGGTSPAAADRAAADATEKFDEKPELFIAGAFVGAFVVAKILKKLTGGGGD